MFFSFLDITCVMYQESAIQTAVKQTTTMTTPPMKREKEKKFQPRKPEQKNMETQRIATRDPTIVTNNISKLCLYIITIAFYMVC